MQHNYPNEKTKRFHTPAYKKRVNDARRYKRRASVVPSEESIARRKWLKAIPVILGIGLLIYLVYFATFLQLRTLTVTGADSTLQAQVQQLFSTSLGQYDKGLPQRNILFFSKDRFQKVVQADGLVARVQSIKKDFWHTIHIVVIQRVPAYLLQTPTSSYVIANDGAVSAVLAPTDPVPQGLLTVTDSATDVFQTGDSAFSSVKISYITTIQNTLSQYAQTTVQSYAMSSKDSDFLTVTTAAGYQILLDSTGNAPTDLQHLQSILAQQGTNYHLAYIDLRFNPRVYVCAVGQPCATAPTIINPPAAPAPPTSATQP